MSFVKSAVKNVAPTAQLHRGVVAVQSSVAASGNVVKTKAATVDTPLEIFSSKPAKVGIELGTTMSQNYQTVVTRVYVELPSAPDEAGLKATRARAFTFAEDTLAETSAWARDVLLALSGNK